MNTLSPTISTKNTTKIDWPAMPGSSLALSIAKKASDHLAPTLIITQNTFMVSKLAEEIPFFIDSTSRSDILLFPDWETLPYDQFSPHQDIISDRLTTLSRLSTLTRGIVITSITTLMQRLAPREFIESNAFMISSGDSLDVALLRQRLERAGYYCVNQVMEHGEFAVRGSIIDIFPMGSPQPFRLDLLDNEIESIRYFDPDTQRSITKVSQIQLLPAREFPLTEEAIARFRQQWREYFPSSSRLCPIYEDISNGIAFAGIEYYLPFFFEKTASFLDYLPLNTQLILVDNVGEASSQFWQDATSRYEQLRHDTTHPILTPQQIFFAPNDLFTNINHFSRIKASHAESIEFPDIQIDSRAKNPLHKLAEYLSSHPFRILFCAETLGRREILLEHLNSINIKPKSFETWHDFIASDESIGMVVGPLSQGFTLPESNISVITESLLFGEHVMQRRLRKTKSQDTELIIRDLSELTVGSPVVHLDYGVGRYLGLNTLSIGETTNEFLTLEYAHGDKIYVPVTSLHLITRYSGVDVENAPLHRLGTDQWSRAKSRAQKRIRDVAAELLDLYAHRASRKGYSYPDIDEHYRAFANQFPFEETPDQHQAIVQVLSDMHAPKPMDRLICGDVGFGKTEVAMRAAFIAVESGKQVAVLVPTTLLANQHFQTFKDRFANWPVRIEELSRFRSQKEQQSSIGDLANGKIDIIIGTHKLIQPSIRFADLGLLIIDEEHRFGVQQKERLKALRAEVDILTLTATPIPRTLNMAFASMRDLSIIATPPAKRLSIKTFVIERDNNRIRESIQREMQRGGQVFFLHNSVDTIARTAREISELIPEARVGIAHGQMPERQLETTMRDFYHQRFNVLVCTTIIETGIDIPTANTIIIDRADKFGLAQLHQLRGRVGRSHHQAYAYLLIPNKKTLSNDAQKRLDAIVSLEDLGAGFTLATHDLEIRGAGELLGAEQSGNMQEIGFSLYMELLDRAVKSLKEGIEPNFSTMMQTAPEIELQITALLPSDYVHDIQHRLSLYKRIASAKDSDTLKDLEVELIDRFGLLPEPAKYLFKIAELKLKAQILGIKKVEANQLGGRIEFHAEPHVDPLIIIDLIQKQSNRYKLDSKQRLRYTIDQTTPEQKIVHLQQIFDILGAK